MEPKAQFVFFLLALICFVVSAFWSWDEPNPGPRWRSPNLIALGLAFFDFVFMYNAYKTI